MADSNTGSEDHVIKKPLNLATITRELRNIAYCWHELGVLLDIDPNVLKLIESNHRNNDVQRPFSETMKFWLDHCQDKSWEKIADALRIIGQTHLASQVAQYDHHGTEDTSISHDIIPWRQYQVPSIYNPLPPGATGSLFSQQPYLQTMNVMAPTFNFNPQHGTSTTHTPQSLPIFSTSPWPWFTPNMMNTLAHTNQVNFMPFYHNQQLGPFGSLTSQMQQQGAITGSCDTPPPPKVPRLQQGSIESAGTSYGPRDVALRSQQQSMLPSQQQYQTHSRDTTSGSTFHDVGSVPAVDQTTDLSSGVYHHHESFDSELQMQQALSLRQHHVRSPVPHQSCLAPVRYHSGPSNPQGSWPREDHSIRSSVPPVTTQDDSHESCRRKLKEYYSHQPEVPDSTWPPVKASKHVKLALIKSQAIDFGNDFARETVRGSIDDIMKKKDEIAYEEAFNDLEDGARVLLEGRPGCGKTTLMHKISRDCALGNILQSHMLFLAHLRRFGNRADIGLEDILCGVNVEFTPEEIEHLSTHIKTTGGKGCVFALDGLDEYEPGTKDTFISKLIQKKIYPNAIVIVASRPAATHRFRKYSSKRIEVLGFHSKQVKEYVNSYFDDQTEMAEGLMSYLELHPNVMHMAYLPLHVAMICSLYKIERSALPSTETEIYRHFALSTLIRGLCKTKDIQDTDSPFLISSFDELETEHLELFAKICELAFLATTSSKQVFSFADVKDIFHYKLGSTGNDESTLGLIVVDRYFVKYGLNETYTFLHLTFQEYLAAYHITRQSSDEQHQIIQKYGAEKRLAQVWKFYCGTATFSDAKLLENLKLLLDSVKENTLLCLQCTYEAKNDFACSHIITSQDGKLSFSGTLNPTDTTALGYALSCADQSSTPCTEVTLKSCRFGPESLDALVKATGDEIQHLETISFHCTEIKTSMEGGLAEFLKKLKTTRTLDLSHCKLRLQTLSLLQSQSVIPSTLTTLNLGDNSSLGARAIPVIQSIKDALPNLKTLEIPWTTLEHGADKILKLLHGVDTGFWADVPDINLRGDYIGADGAQSLAEGLSHCTNLQTLDLARDRIGHDYAKSLAEGLTHCTNLQTLGLSSCQLEEGTLSVLLSAIPTSVTTLNLSSCQLKESTLFVLQSAIPTSVTTLNLGGNPHMSEQALPVIQRIKNGLPNLQTLTLPWEPFTPTITSMEQFKVLVLPAIKKTELLPNFELGDVTKISLDRNNIGADGAQSLVEGLSHCTNLQTLVLGGNNIGADGAQSLAEGLSHCTNLQTLFLQENNIGADGAKFLAEGLSHCTNLQKLYLQENNIGADGAQSLAEGLSHCTNLQILYLWENNIGDDGAKSLAEGLSHCTNLQRLSLRGNSISDESVEHLTRLIKTAPKMKTFYLTGNKFSESGRVDLRKAKEERNLNSELCHMELVV